MNEAPRRWTLKLGGELMAVLWFESYETPWISVRVEARPELERFRLYFADEETWPDDDRGFDALLGEVAARGGFTLAAEGGPERREFTLVDLDAQGGADPEFANLRGR